MQGTLLGLWRDGELIDNDDDFDFGPSRAKTASRSLRRALLTPQVNTGSLYRCAKSTFKRAAFCPRLEEKEAEIRPKKRLWQLDWHRVRPTEFCGHLGDRESEERLLRHGGPELAGFRAARLRHDPAWDATFQNTRVGVSSFFLN